MWWWLYADLCHLSPGSPWQCALSGGSHPGWGTAQVYAALVEVRLGDVAGFDLTTMNAYRWHPHTERVDLSR